LLYWGEILLTAYSDSNEPYS
jgi:hypothetical protein